MDNSESRPGTRWWWVRHAPVPHLADRIYGSTDPDADCTDVEAFAALAARLPGGAVWCVSHLRRTHQTAEAIREAGGHVPALRIEPALGEQNLGELHGRRHVDHEAARDDPFVGFWPAHPEHAPAGGESWVDVRTRVSAAVQAIAREHDGRDIVCVAHGGPIVAAVADALDLAPRTAVSISVPTLSVTRLFRLRDPQPDGPRYRVLGIGERALVR